MTAVTTYRCINCGDIVLIVLPGEQVDPVELAAKGAAHGKQHDDLEAMLDDKESS